MPGERLVALIAAEMLQVEDVVLCAGVLGGEDELVAGAAPRHLGLVGVVAGAEHLAVLVVVEQVHQEFLEKVITVISSEVLFLDVPYDGQDDKYKSSKVISFCRNFSRRTMYSYHGNN